MALTDPSRPTDVALLTDLYELTMAQGLWEHGKLEERDCFTAFYRDHPFGSAYAVMCGTAELADLVENTRFTSEDIDYLASLKAPAGGALFKPGFLEYLRDFRMHVDIDAVLRGAPNAELKKIVNGVVGRMPSDFKGTVANDIINRVFITD